MTIPASLIRQYCFCPRIPFFQFVMGLRLPSPLWVRQGLDFHEREALLSKSRTLSRYDRTEGRLFLNVKMKSISLNIHGFCDALIFTDDEIIPIEFKLTCPKPTKGQKQQLAAYSLLAQDNFARPVQQAYIAYGKKGKTHKIIIDEDLIRSTRKTVEKIDELIIAQTMPDSSATSAQCGQCEYINYCNDRD